MALESPRGIEVLEVTHTSRVAAVSTSAGPRRLLAAGLAEALGATRLPVDVTSLDAPTDVRGAVGRSFAVADRVARRVCRAIGRRRLPVVLSGSCHTGLGSVSGLPRERPRGIVWLDRHGDFNTPETTRSGLLDGTTLACVTGRGWTRLQSVCGYAPVPDRDVLLIGARDLDPDEARLLDGSDVTILTGDAVPDRASEAIRALGGRVGSVYLHIDLDVFDPRVARANAYATESGLSAEGALLVLDTAFGVTAAQVVALTSYDPSVDPEGKVVEVALSIGRRIARRVAA